MTVKCDQCGGYYEGPRCSTCYYHDTKNLSDKELVYRTAERLGESPEQRWNAFQELVRRHSGRFSRTPEQERP